MPRLAVEEDVRTEGQPVAQGEDVALFQGANDDGKDKNA